jgi:hypothetical protein
VNDVEFQMLCAENKDLRKRLAEAKGEIADDEHLSSREYFVRKVRVAVQKWDGQNYEDLMDLFRIYLGVDLTRVRSKSAAQFGIRRGPGWPHALAVAKGEANEDRPHSVKPKAIIVVPIGSNVVDVTLFAEIPPPAPMIRWVRNWVWDPPRN